MKTKDIVALVVSVVILLAASYLIYTQVMPRNKTGAGAPVKVEVVGPISGDFNAEALTTLTDGTKVRNYAVSFDLKTGLGNQAVFGQ